jgi:hypothetical protein
LANVPFKPAAHDFEPKYGTPIVAKRAESAGGVSV